MPKDLCSVLLLPSKQRVWSFLSLAAGLMVDLDIGTEHLRWMGDTRFTLGFIKGVGSSKNHRMSIKMRVVAEDKVEMARTAREWAKRVLAEPPVGGGVDPLVNGVKKIAIREDDARATTSTPAVPSVDKPVVNGANGSKSIDDEGPLPESQLLEPDETWTVIESGPKPATAAQVKKGTVSTTGQSGGWIDGQGILYA
jgi:sphingosine kinase